MPGKFDVAFVLTKNLKLPHFPVNQCTATFQVKGDTDPLTLQEMRDAIFPEFQKTQTKVNQFIEAQNLKISKLSVNDRKAKKHLQLFEAGNKTIERLLAEFKTAADGQLEAYGRRQMAKAEKVASAPTNTQWGVKWLVSIGWSAYQGYKGVMDFASGESPLKILDGIKGFIDAAKDILGLVQKLLDQRADEKTVNARIRAALKTLGSKKVFTEGDVKSLEDLVSLYEAKVLAMEMSGKSLSAKVASAVTAIPADGITPEAAKQAEKALDEVLKELVKLQTAVKPAQEKLKKYKLTLGAAKQQAKKEPASWLTWAVKGYEFKEAGFLALDQKFAEMDWELAEKGIDAVIKTFGDPGNVIRK